MTNNNTIWKVYRTPATGGRENVKHYRNCPPAVEHAKNTHEADWHWISETLVHGYTESGKIVIEEVELLDE